MFVHLVHSSPASKLRPVENVFLLTNILSLWNACFCIWFDIVTPRQNGRRFEDKILQFNLLKLKLIYFDSYFTEVYSYLTIWRQINIDSDINWRLYKPLFEPISNPKNHCFSNAVLQYSYCILRTSDHNFDFKNNNVEGDISKCLFHTTNNVCSSQGVGERKFKLANYNRFSTVNYIADKNSLLELELLRFRISHQRIVPPCKN